MSISRRRRRRGNTNPSPEEEEKDDDSSSTSSDRSSNSSSSSNSSNSNSSDEEEDDVDIQHNDSDDDDDKTNFRNNNNTTDTDILYKLTICLCTIVCIGVVLFGFEPENIVTQLTNSLSAIIQKQQSQQQQHKHKHKHSGAIVSNIDNNNNNNKSSPPRLIDIVHNTAADAKTIIVDTMDEDTIRCQTTLNALDDHFNHRRQLRQHHAPNHFNNNNNGRTPSLLELFDPYEPEAACITEERFGHDPNRYQAFGDGPKFLCGIDMMIREAVEYNNHNNNHNAVNNKKNKKNNKKKHCLIYSFGMIPDVKFELDLVKTFGDDGLCDIHIFNPAIDASTFGTTTTEGGESVSSSSSVTVHPWGLGHVDGGQDTYLGRTFETFTLQTIMKKLGHDDNNNIDNNGGAVIDILKIDMERFEYDHMPTVLEGINTKNADHSNTSIQIHQLLLELHAFGIENPTLFYNQQIASMFNAIDKADLRIFHKERNGWQCDGAKCVEYAFASSKFLRKANAQLICGHREDFIHDKFNNNNNNNGNDGNDNHYLLRGGGGGGA